MNIVTNPSPIIYPNRPASPPPPTPSSYTYRYWWIASSLTGLGAGDPVLSWSEYILPPKFDSYPLLPVDVGSEFYPTFQPNGLVTPYGSFPCVDFDGFNNSLSTVATLPGLTGNHAMTFIGVFKWNSAVQGGYVAGLGDGAGPTDWATLGLTPGNESGFYNNGAFIGNGFAGRNGIPLILGFRNNGSGTVKLYDRDVAGNNRDSSGAISTNLSASKFSVGRVNGAAPASAWPGSVAEMILYDGFLSDADVNGVLSYLRFKYGFA